MKENRILAISSSGGHWQQLQLILSQLDPSSIHYVCTSTPAGMTDNFTLVQDFSRDSLGLSVRSTLQIFSIVWRLKPRLVVSTGAAPGLVGVFMGRLVGAKTIWVDSVANSERLSLCGRVAARFCTLTVSQWKHIADKTNTRFFGSLL